MLIDLCSGQKLLSNIVTNINFGIQWKKKIRDCKIYSPFSHFIGKGFISERPTLQGVNLVVLLNEKQTLIENFFLRNDPHKSTEYLNFFLESYYYRDINLYFAHDKQNKQWFTSGHEFYNEAICKKVTNKNFNLKKFARKFYYIDKRESGYAIGNAEQRCALGNRSYLMPIVWGNDDIWLATNEIFYKTANASQLRGSRTFLKNSGLKYMGSYWLKDSDKKELKSILPNFQLEQFHSWMYVDGHNPSYQDELIFWPSTYF